jgi:hypothetical protein
MKSEYEQILNEISELKNSLSIIEQDIVDEKLIDMNDYRIKLKQLFWLKLERDRLEWEEKI